MLNLKDNLSIRNGIDDSSIEDDLREPNTVDDGKVNYLQNGCILSVDETLPPATNVNNFGDSELRGLNLCKCNETNMEENEHQLYKMNNCKHKTFSNSKCDSIENNSRLVCNNINSRKNSSCSSNNNTINRINGGYLIAVHRKLSRQDTYFLSYHKSRPSLFGVPLLIPCYEGGTNKDLYCAVWIQVARLLSPLPPTPPDQANHATDW